MPTARRRTGARRRRRATGLRLQPALDGLPVVVSRKQVRVRGEIVESVEGPALAVPAGRLVLLDAHALEDAVHGVGDLLQVLAVQVAELQLLLARPRLGHVHLLGPLVVEGTRHAAELEGHARVVTAGAWGPDEVGPVEGLGLACPFAGGVGAAVVGDEVKRVCWHFDEGTGDAK